MVGTLGDEYKVLQSQDLRTQSVRFVLPASQNRLRRSEHLQTD